MISMRVACQLPRTWQEDISSDSDSEAMMPMENVAGRLRLFGGSFATGRRLKFVFDFDSETQLIRQVTFIFASNMWPRFKSTHHPAVQQVRSLT